MKSEFLTPIKIENRETFVSTVSDDENVFAMLFASSDDYKEANIEIEPKRVPFEITFHMLKNRVDGFIININSREFILDEDFIERNLVSYTADELKDINDNAFHGDEDITDGIFLTLLLSDEDYSSKASNGIISANGKTFDMATVKFDDRLYHLLFTSKEHLINAFEIFPGLHHYSQIIDLSELIRNFLERNIEGILLDFPDGFKCISTKELSRLDVKENVRLRRSLNYVFEVE